MASDLTLGAEGFIRAVTEFIYVADAPEKADVIFVPGAARPEHALRAAELYHEGFAPCILPSGRYSITAGKFLGVKEAFREDYAGEYETEWAFLREVLLRAGVPDSAILREDQATYTWDNALKSRSVTDGLGMDVRRAILCCKPFHARRALMYYQAAYPHTEFFVCPSRMPGYDREDWFETEKGRSLVLGEVRRLGDQVKEVFELMMQQKP